MTGMAATGIPSHLAMSNELTAVAKQTEVLKEALLSKCTELPTELVNVMLNKFTVNGAIPVTVDDIKTLLNNAIHQLRIDLRDTTPTAPPASSFPSSSLIDPSSDPRFQYWMWGGRMHMVPQGWRFPSTDLKATWHLWHFGHVEHRIRPLRYLKKSDLSGNSITRWSKTHGVVKAVAQMMVETGRVQSIDGVQMLTVDESSAAFDSAIVKLMEKLREGSIQGRGRWMEMSVSTLYDLLRKAERERKRKRRRNEAGEGDRSGVLVRLEDTSEKRMRE